MKYAYGVGQEGSKVDIGSQVNIMLKPKLVVTLKIQGVSQPKM